MMETVVVAIEPTRYTSKEAAELVGIPYRTLMSWVQYGLLTPEGAGCGQGQSITWTPKDIQEAKNLCAFRNRRLNITVAKSARRHMVALHENPFSRGTTFPITDNTGRVTDVVRCLDGIQFLLFPAHQGQLILSFDDGED